jgi:hypothetical protein
MKQYRERGIAEAIQFAESELEKRLGDLGPDVNYLAFPLQIPQWALVALINAAKGAGEQKA